METRHVHLQTLISGPVRGDVHCAGSPSAHGTCSPYLRHRAPGQADDRSRQVQVPGDDPGHATEAEPRRGKHSGYVLDSVAACPVALGEDDVCRASRRSVHKVDASPGRIDVKAWAKPYAHGGEPALERHRGGRVKRVSWLLHTRVFVSLPWRLGAGMTEHTEAGESSWCPGEAGAAPRQCCR